MFDSFCTLVMLLNALWTGCAFVQFTLKKTRTLQLVLPKPLRSQSDSTEPVWACVRFLGTINLAVAMLATVLVLAPVYTKSLFTDPAERIVLALFFAAVHFSQFAGNLPILLARKPVWPVLKGMMLQMFITDATMTVLNVVVAGGLLAGLYQTW